MKWSWWPHTLDTRVASYRLRCQQIIAALRLAGYDVGLYQPDHSPPSVLVLSKRYDRHTLQVATALRAQSRTQIVLDLCDNHFVFSADPDGKLIDRANALRQTCATVDMVITASQALGDVVRYEVPTARVTVIPDAAEPPATPPWRIRLRNPAASWRLCRLEHALRGFPGPRRLVWFGNHGSPGVDAGLQDLAMVRHHLESAAASAPLALTVISNNEAAFEAVTRGWRMPVFYLPWDACTFSAALHLQSVAIIPISPNAFTLCKTANRVLTAALHGLNVIADAIPSYQPLRDSIILDQWSYAMGKYLDEASRRQRDRVRLLELATAEYSIEQVSSKWRETLERL